jgi:hypothetical protein
MSTISIEKINNSIYWFNFRNDKKKKFMFIFNKIKRLDMEIFERKK